MQRNWGFALPLEQAASVDKRLYLASNALAAANRAIELAPNDAFVRGIAARAAWMACQPDQMRIETRRAIALNPNDPQNLGPLGTLMAASGFWDEGVSIAEKGIALTAPSTPPSVVVGDRKNATGSAVNILRHWMRFGRPLSTSSGSAISRWPTRCRSLTATKKPRRTPRLS